MEERVDKKYFICPKNSNPEYWVSFDVDWIRAMKKAKEQEMDLVDFLECDSGWIYKDY